MLASASAARRALLQAAGLTFETVPPHFDETEVKRAARDRGASAGEAALDLARLKAGAVTRPGAVVVGCDQILVCGDDWFDKPAGINAARRHLQALRGRTHSLATACVALRDGTEVFSILASPVLSMRRFSDAFLDLYLDAEGDRILGSVGAYRLEGAGMHLFDEIDGDHSAILGLPMLPLLGFLRACGMIAD